MLWLGTDCLRNVTVVCGRVRVRMCVCCVRCGLFEVLSFLFVCLLVCLCVFVFGCFVCFVGVVAVSLAGLFSYMPVALVFKVDVCVYGDCVFGVVPHVAVIGLLRLSCL